MFKVSEFHHASLIVSDTKASLLFYQNLLGLQTDAARPDLGYPGAWLNIGRQQLHLLELPNPDPVDNRPVHGGRDRHLAFRVDNISDLVEALQRGNIDYTLSKSGRKAVFCRDPDCNALEFIEG
jgi:glyoxylase I family protein